MGVINLIDALIERSAKLNFYIIMAIGLILAMLGDIFLGFNFILGAGLFASGHICFAVSYCVLQKFNKLDLLLAGILFAATGSFVLFCPLLTFSDGVMQGVCAVYALIISTMVGKALGSFIKERNAVTAVIALGSVLFFILDLMLVFDWFMDCGRWSGLICMATYYPAECLLAFSGWVLGSKRK